MTDRQIAGALAAALGIETDARATWTTTTDLPDKDAALVVMRHATATRRMLESWIAKRALRAHLMATAGTK